MVRTTMAIEREINYAWSIRDENASVKRKEDQPSSSWGKRQRTSIPLVSQGWGCDYQG